MRRTNKGSSLIEVLTVIVVFLVGILALLQAFPTGLNVLRTTRSNSLAASLARAEMQRLQGAADTLPDMVVPVVWRAGGSIVEVNPGKNWRQMMPEMGASSTVLDIDGNVIADGLNNGRWDRIGGANQFNRIIGEGGPVPAPREVGSLVGGLLQLQFGPIFYSRSAGTGVGQPGVLTAYANDLVRRWGDPERNRPNPDARGRDFEFFFVDDEADSPIFNGVEQIWVPRLDDGSSGGLNSILRISYSFTLNQGAGGFTEHDVIVVINPATAGSSIINTLPRWEVVNLRQLLSLEGSGYDPGQVATVDEGSVRVQRVYEEIPLTDPFTVRNPYQFKAINGNLGALLFNPSASTTKLGTAEGGTTSLAARVDYTVLDWRNIRDGFRIPTSSSFPTVRLALQSIKSRSSDYADGRPFPGLGFEFPDAFGAVTGVQDFCVVDDETGGVILGNEPGGTFHSYFVDKRNGVISFIDVDPIAAGTQVWLTVPQPDGTWANPVAVSANGRAVRALYQAAGEWSVQLHKPARSYRVSNWIGSGLQAGQCYVRVPESTSTLGTENRVYFPLSDLGGRVVVNEMRFINSGTSAPGVVYDQELLIDGTEEVGGVLYSFADATAKIGGGNILSSGQTGFALRGVRGASIRVRVMWNPERFSLLADGSLNFQSLQGWMNEMRRVETESFVIPGGSQ